MSRYIPNTEQQQKEMLNEIGYSSTEELFRDIPSDIRLKRKLDLPPAMDEMKLLSHMGHIAQANRSLDELVCFLGAGSYDHFVPSAVKAILSRQEFYTAYTPYQPEISQGTLQAIFEYQTMICELTGMDAANASMYDGATALAEAASMARQVTRKRTIIVAKTVHPEYRSVLNTYSRFSGSSVNELDYRDGQMDLDKLKNAINEDSAEVIVQTPNFFGIIENLQEIEEITHRYNALLLVCVDPISLAILKPPGEFGADIVVGEGQSLGNQTSFGGPYLGFFASSNKLLRKMPGRIVGLTKDQKGRRGFVLTMQTREQHIRRERATSNICTNQALNALAATVYMTLLGRQGLREVALLSLQKAHYAQSELIKTGVCKELFNGPFFKEFAVRSVIPVSKLNKILLKENILGGYELERDYPDLAGSWLLAVTEKRSKEEIDKLVKVVRGVIE